jgi:hypothetical protein
MIAQPQDTLTFYWQSSIFSFSQLTHNMMEAIFELEAGQEIVKTSMIN